LFVKDTGIIGRDKRNNQCLIKKNKDFTAFGLISQNPAVNQILILLKPLCLTRLSGGSTKQDPLQQFFSLPEPEYIRT